MKYGVTSNLTADFTLNPDFSQIEADRPQIETNQRYPLFFPELRPVLPGGTGDLPHARPHEPRPHQDHRRPRRSAPSSPARPATPRWAFSWRTTAAPGKFDDANAYGFGGNGELRHRAGPLRHLLAVVHRGDHDRPRVPRLVQPGGGGRRPVPARADAPGAVPGGHLVAPRPRRQHPERADVQRRDPARQPPSQLQLSTSTASTRTSAPMPASSGASTCSSSTPTSSTNGGPRAG